jgi:hypothetical protein
MGGNGVLEHSHDWSNLVFYLAAVVTILTGAIKFYEFRTRRTRGQTDGQARSAKWSKLVIELAALITIVSGSINIYQSVKDRPQTSFTHVAEDERTPEPEPLIDMVLRLQPQGLHFRVEGLESCKTSGDKTGRQDGVLIETEGFHVFCKPGSHEIKASREGFTSETKIVLLAANKRPGPVEIRLSPDPQSLGKLLAEAAVLAREATDGPTQAAAIADAVLAEDPNNKVARTILVLADFRSRNLSSFVTDSIEAIRGGSEIEIDFQHRDSTPEVLLHPTTLVIAPTYFYFKHHPSGGCSLPPNAVLLKSIDTADVRADANGSVSLLLRFRDPMRDGRTAEFTLWDPDAHLEPGNRVVSRADSETVLGRAAELLQYASTRSN